MTFIDEISIYDPKINGYAPTSMKLFSDREQQTLRELIYNRANASIIEDNTNLKQYLFGKNGYFQRNQKISQVIFIDGKFHSAQSQEESYRVSLDKIAEEFNAIPLFFSRVL